MHLAEPSDAHLVEQVLQGRVEAFQVLLERYQDSVASIVGRRIPRDEGEDVAQEVFVRAFQSLAGFRGETPFGHWLSKVALNTCYDYWRKRYRRREVSLASLSEEAERWLENQAWEGALSLEDQASQRQSREVLVWALAQLPPADRMVVTLVHLEERSTAEAAELMGWSVANVKVRCFRARKKLRKLLDRALPEGI